MPPVRPQHGRPLLTGVKSLRGLGIAVSALLGIALLASAMSAVEFFDRADLMAADPDIHVLPLVEGADSSVLGRLLLAGLLTVAAGSLLIVWQYLYAKNAQLIGGPLPLAPAWAIAGWFVPVANLVLPYMQLGQSYAASDPVIPADDSRLPKAVFAWLTANLFSAVLFATSVVLRRGTTVDRFVLADRVAGAAMLLYAAAGVFAILSVVTLTRRQRWAVIPVD